MDMETVLTAIDAWPIEDRLRLVEEIWARLVDHGLDPELAESLKSELDRRLAADDAAPDDAVPWEEVKATALARIRR
jgi:putative addiction module component (TIGR02574 family)